jgi:hypothetical protein
MMRVLEMVHWGLSDNGYNCTLPRTEAEALAQYRRAATVAQTRGTKAYGSRGVTVFLKAVTVRGVVRGYDAAGDPTMFMIIDDQEGDGEPSDATDPAECAADLHHATAGQPTLHGGRPRRAVRGEPQDDL